MYQPVESIKGLLLVLLKVPFVTFGLKKDSIMYVDHCLAISFFFIRRSSKRRYLMLFIHLIFRSVQYKLYIRAGFKNVTRNVTLNWSMPMTVMMLLLVLYMLGVVNDLSSDGNHMNGNNTHYSFPSSLGWWWCCSCCLSYNTY